MFGFLNVDKPIGRTSRDAVNVVQRALRPLKVGHAGTLDPLATGVLVIAVGQATRLIDLVQQQAKTYVATFRFGISSQTDDLEGPLVEVPGELPTREQIESLLPEFVGRIEQVPPAYSAVKIQGERAYRLARTGQDVELTPRMVRVDRLTIDAYQAPDLHLTVECGAGTYIRSLGRDLGKALGTAAVMTSLRRTAIGGFHVEQAVAWDDLLAADTGILESWLIDPFVALPSLPVVELSLSDCRALRLGKGIAAVPSSAAIESATGESKAEDSLALGRDPWRQAHALLKRVDESWRIDKAFRADLPLEELEELPMNTDESAEVRQAIARDRQHWAAELHDGLAQELVGAKLLIDALGTGSEIAPERLERTLAKVSSLLDGAAQEARRLIARLDEPRGIDDDLSAVERASEERDPEVRRGTARQRLDTWQARLSEEWPECQLDIRISELPDDAEFAWDIWRIVQEATRNALAHGQAKRIDVELVRGQAAGEWRLTIIDDGIGFDPAAGTERFGLKGMRARTERRGGSWSLNSAPGQGTRIVASWC